MVLENSFKTYLRGPYALDPPAKELKIAIKVKAVANSNNIISLRVTTMKIF